MVFSLAPEKPGMAEGDMKGHHSEKSLLTCEQHLDLRKTGILSKTKWKITEQDEIVSLTIFSSHHYLLVQRIIKLNHNADKITLASNNMKWLFNTTFKDSFLSIVVFWNN